MKGINGKISVITGAGRGIGRAIALRLVEEGSMVVINDLDASPLEEVAKAIDSLGGKCVIVPGSVDDPDTVKRVIGSAADAFGDLHIVVTCAGFTWDSLLHKMSDEQWQSIIDVHLTGTFRIIRESLAFMRQRARDDKDNGLDVSRKVVTVSSSSAYGNFGQSNYAAAKAGIVGLTKTAAIEGAQFNIMVNAVAFGVIDTRLTRDKETGETFMGTIPLGIPKDIRDKVLSDVLLKRPGSVQEAAGAAVFLASEDADYITGHVLDVNGGLRL